MCFGNPKMQLTDRYDGQNDPCAHIAKLIQEYGKQPTLMRINSVLRGMVNKRALGG